MKNGFVLGCDVWTVDKEFYLTIEKKEMVERALPHLVEAYQLSILHKANAKKAPSRKTSKLSGRVVEWELQLDTATLPIVHEAFHSNENLLFRTESQRTATSRACPVGE